MVKLLLQEKNLKIFCRKLMMKDIEMVPITAILQHVALKL